TTIVVTHDQDEAMSLADRIIVMNRGRIEQQGTPDEIYMQPETAFVAGFIGRTNWFRGNLSAGSGDGYARFTTATGTVLAIRAPAAMRRGIGDICIRPERMTVGEASAKAGRSGENILPGRVVDVVNMGAEIHYIVDGAEGRIMVVEPNRQGPRVHSGDQVSLLFHAEDCAILPRDGS
ncbi:MAG TPA: TOBE domain-containing protein, partial [Dongiaceae bacterium]